MTFGSDFHSDQLDQVNVYAQDSHKFIQEVRDYVKECLELEREYADKMDRLGKMYSKRLKKVSGLFYGTLGMKWKDKRHGSSSIAVVLPSNNVSTDRSSLGSISSGGNTMTSSTLLDEDTTSLISNEEQTDLSSLMRSWMILLSESTLSSRQHRILSEVSSSMFSDPLKLLLNRMDEMRKRHIQFGMKLYNDLEKSQQEVEKLRLRYDEAFKRYENAQIALDKCPDELSVEYERLRRQCDQTRQFQKELFNEYLLAFDSAQVYKEKYYKEDLPMLMDRLQSMIEYYVIQLRTLLLSHVTHETNLRLEQLKCWEKVNTVLHQIDEKTDSDLFMKHHRRVYPEEVTPLMFQPPLSLFSSSNKNQQHHYYHLDHGQQKSYPHSNDINSQPMLLIDEQQVKVILDNRLHKSRLELEEVESSLSVQSKEIEGLQKLFDVYTRQPELGDATQVQEVRYFNSFILISLINCGRDRL